MQQSIGAAREIVSARILVVYKKNFEGVHDTALEKMGECLDALQSERGVTTDFKARERVHKSDFTSRDLIITLGGDGTLTSISHNILDDTPVMGVNSDPQAADPQGSVGFFLDSDMLTFREDIRAALDGQATLNRMPRLQAEITTTSGNVMRSDPALNDLLVSNTHQYMPSKYRLQRGGIDVHQQSSGLLFSTFYGQGAWFRHVCNIEQRLFDADEIGSHYLVVARDLHREVREVDPAAYSDWTAEATVITSDMHRGYVVPDGWDEVHFVRGASVRVGIDAPPLNLLTFRTPMVDRLSHLLGRLD